MYKCIEYRQIQLISLFFLRVFYNKYNIIIWTYF